MNRYVIASIVTLALVVATLIQPVERVSAQSTPTGSSFGFGIGTSPCQSPTTGLVLICGTATGLQVSVNGGAYAPVGGNTAGVTTFNGRSGAVTPTTGDYNFSQIGGTLSPTQVPAMPIQSAFGCTTFKVVSVNSDGSWNVTQSGCK